MTECFVYIAVYDRYEGVIIDDVIYFRNEEKELLTMMDMEMYLYHGNMEPVKFSVDGKWGLVDIITGKIIIDPIWDFIGYLHNGYIRVGLGGHLVIENQYDEDLVGGKYGYIDERGEIVVPLDYDQVSERSYKDYFIVRKDNEVHIINKDNLLQNNLTDQEKSDIERSIDFPTVTNY